MEVCEFRASSGLLARPMSISRRSMENAPKPRTWLRRKMRQARRHELRFRARKSPGEGLDGWALPRICERGWEVRGLLRCKRLVASTAPYNQGSSMSSILAESVGDVA